MENFVAINRKIDFEYAKEKSKRLIINSLDHELISMARDGGFSVYVEKNCTENVPVHILSGIAGRTSREAGSVLAVTCDTFEKMLMGIGGNLENIDGFILPIPKPSGLLWSDAFEKALNKNPGELFDVFDEYVPESDVRLLYYEMAEEYLVLKFIEPLHKMAKKIGKSITFYMGTGEMQYDFMPILNPIRLIYEGYSLAFEKQTPEIKAFCNLNKPEKSESVLLVKPVRGCRRKYVYSGKKLRVRQENPALCASYEGTYYCERLAELGMEFLAIDEYTLENSAYVQDGSIALLAKGFKNVIICDGCSFK